MSHYNVKVTIVAEYEVDETDYDIDDPKTTRKFIEEDELRGIQDDLSVIATDVKSIGISVWKVEQQ